MGVVRKQLMILLKLGERTPSLDQTRHGGGVGAVNVGVIGGEANREGNSSGQFVCYLCNRNEIVAKQQSEQMY